MDFFPSKRGFFWFVHYCVSDILLTLQLDIIANKIKVHAYLILCRMLCASHSFAWMGTESDGKRFTNIQNPSNQSITCSSNFSKGENGITFCDPALHEL